MEKQTKLARFIMVDPITSFWLILLTTIGSYGLYLQITNDKRASSYFVYGKSLELKKKKGLFWQLFLLPKRFFRHFYLSALLVFGLSFAAIFLYYSPSNPVQSELIKYVNIIQHFSVSFEFKLETVDNLDSVNVLLFTLILMSIQVARRLYESLFVSVFSSNSKINIIHYLFGHAFYMAAALSTICPILFSETSNKFTPSNLIGNLVNRRRAIVFVLFIYISHYQHKCHHILANLRKDKSGRVITEQHYVPSGGLFEYVSCPHFLTEIIIYLLIVFVQEFSSSYWNLIFLLVLTTQIINAITEHKWYKAKYNDYPKERRAILPKLL